MKNLIELKKKQKKKKPNFIRQESLRKRLKNKWRRPKGIHSKIRLREAGKRARVSIGYGTPKNLRGLHKEGLKYIRISNLKDVDNLKENQIIVLAKIGGKKKQQILKEIIKRKLKISNLDPKKFLEKYENKRKEKKQKRAERAKKKSEKDKKKKKDEEKKKETEKKPEKQIENKEEIKPKEEKKDASKSKKDFADAKGKKEGPKKEEVKTDEKIKTAEETGKENK